MPCNEDHPAAIHARPQADPPAPPIECPKCHTRMNAIAIDDITVDQCQRCGGLWLDAMGKEQLLTDRTTVKSIDTDPAAIGRRQDDLTAIKCSLDHSTMIRMSDPGQKHVHYERCTICGGVFFDAGELAELSKVSLRQRVRSFQA